MRSNWLYLIVLTAAATFAVGFTIATVRAQVVGQPFLTMSPDKLRFRLVGDEPIAAPDGHSAVSGWKVVVLRDLKSDQCYVTFISGSSMAVTGPSVCP